MPGEAPSLSAHSSAVSLPAEAQNQLKKHIEQLGGYASDDVAKALGMNGANGGQSKGKSPPPIPMATKPNTGGLEPSMQGQDAFTGPGQPMSRPDSLSALNKKLPSENIGVWVFIDIQLYCLESQTYVVDFKCDGYQNVIWHDYRKERERSRQSNSNSTSTSTVTSPAASRPTSGFGELGQVNSEPLEEEGSDGYWKPVSKRYKNVEKEISSPYPYLDVASDLVAQLWGGGA